MAADSVKAAYFKDLVIKLKCSSAIDEGDNQKSS